MKYKNVEMLSHNEVADLIEAVADKRTVLVQGENGIGKTTIWSDLRRRPKLANHFFPSPVDCAQLDVGDHIVPIPDMERGVTRGMPNERYGIHEGNQRGVNGARPVVLCFDELAKAPKHIQASLMPVAFDRRLGSMHLPEGSVVFATTNLSIEALGDFMQGHTRNRLIIVTLRKPTKDEWVQQFAIPNNLSPEVIAACEHNPDWFQSFLEFEDGGPMAGKPLAKLNAAIYNPKEQQEAYVSPRSLHAVSDIIKASAHLPPNVVESAIGGTIGEHAASVLKAYVTFGRQLPHADRVRQDPMTCPVPDSSTAQIVLVFKLVTVTDSRDDAEKFCQYVGRLQSEMRSLFLNTVAQNTDKVAKYASVTLFREMLKEHRIFFERGDQ